ncbi:SpoIIE family protein phosphatase [Zavarzinia sp. CC-PAN008]|uniref:SpoIIE family protein phosphatase n=1 Tax=Zavarzinia sp. CC-PAN008 TaxID=3243332 RepID=UPI003F7482C3
MESRRPGWSRPLLALVVLGLIAALAWQAISWRTAAALTRETQAVRGALDSLAYLGSQQGALFLGSEQRTAIAAGRQVERLLADGADTARIERSLVELEAALNRGEPGLFLVDAQGKVVATSGPNPAADFPVDAAAVQAAFAGVTYSLSGPVAMRARSASLVVTLPVARPDRTIAYALSSLVDLRPFWNFVELNTVGTFLLAFVDADGAVVAGANDRGRELFGDPLLAADAPAAERVQTASAIRLSGQDGQWIVQRTVIDGWPLSLVAAVSRERIVARARDTVVQEAALAALAVLVLGGLVTALVVVIRRGSAERQRRQRAEAAIGLAGAMMPGGFAVSGPDGRLRYVNQAFAQMLGSESRVLEGSRLSDSLRQAVDRAVLKPPSGGRWDGPAAAPGGDTADLELSSTDGSFHLLRERTTEDGARVLLTTDITEVKRFETRVRQELAMAARVQQSILPTDPPSGPGYELAGTMRPARQVGGDFYDTFALPGGAIGIVVADVSGKGIAAALFMAVARTILRELAQRSAQPSDALRLSNEALSRDNAAEMFVTVFYGVYQPETGRLAYANGGHNPPIVVRRSGRPERLPLTGGVALGMMPDLDYDADEILLEPNDALVLYTDGVTEAVNAAMEDFGMDRLVEALAPCTGQDASTLVTHVVQTVDAFAAQAEQADDLTVLVLRRTA